MPKFLTYMRWQASTIFSICLVNWVFGYISLNVSESVVYLWYQAFHILYSIIWCPSTLSWEGLLWFVTVWSGPAMTVMHPIFWIKNEAILIFSQRNIMKTNWMQWVQSVCDCFLCTMFVFMLTLCTWGFFIHQAIVLQGYAEKSTVVIFFSPCRM
jgi:hypothetical protein